MVLSLTFTYSMLFFSHLFFSHLFISRRTHFLSDVAPYENNRILKFQGYRRSREIWLHDTSLL